MVHYSFLLMVLLGYFLLVILFEVLMYCMDKYIFHDPHLQKHSYFQSAVLGKMIGKFFLLIGKVFITLQFGLEIIQKSISKSIKNLREKLSKKPPQKPTKKGWKEIK